MSRRERKNPTGTSQRQLAERKLPFVISWLRSSFAKGERLSGSAILECPLLDGLAVSTRRSQGYCLISMLVERKILIRTGRGLYLVQFAL